ncbi:nuclear transport factor 2 family protein [Nocardia vaccinii]|uniref:nuclear transport factor 2 family protein n=1 Tax=Nocardia vaccinii TaxID=1822 RepID=UPI00082E4420|nr:nuclear transport factor 2 family protein [Nocardia vaccinii]
MDIWEIAARECVRQTMSDYTAATDRFDLQALAACFSEHGTLRFTGSEPLVGRDAIQAGLGAQLGPGGDRPAPSYVRHHVSSVRFTEVGADQVGVGSCFVVYTDIGVDHWGRYRDVLIPVAERWLFESRSIRVDGYAANSLMRNASHD